MSTAKHYSFCSGPMRGKSVTALPGIGETYGDRLTCAGYSMASDIYEKFLSLSFESIKCQSWLSLICGMNSRYSSMCYEALKEWHVQFGDVQTSSKLSYAPQLETRYEYSSPKPRVDDSYRRYETAYQESPTRSKEPDITRKEVLEMMAQFQNKHDSMIARIIALEQDKSVADAKINSLEKEQAKTNNYIKTLEAKVKQTDRIAAVLQKQQNTSVELYKNMSNSVYLISQKLDETLSKQNDKDQDSIVSNFIKILEARIERIEENLKKHRKEQDKKLFEFAKKLNDINSCADVKDITISLDMLSRKVENIADKQNVNHKQPAKVNQLVCKIGQIEKDFSHLTIELSKLIKNENSKMKQGFDRSCDDTNTEILTRDSNTAMEKSDKVEQSNLPSMVLNDGVVTK